MEVNLLSSALSGLVNQSAAYTAGGVVPFRMGNAHPSVYPYLPLPAKDRDVIIAVGNDRQFRALCETLKLDGVADDPRFAENTQRAANRAELQPISKRRWLNGKPTSSFSRSTPPGCRVGRSTRSPKAFDAGRAARIWSRTCR